MKLLYIGHCIDRITSGADQVNKRNQQLLTEIFHGNIVYLGTSVNRISDKIFLGISKMTLASIRRELDTGEYTHVFIAQSLMGRAARFVKKNYRSVIVITFFHNIEVQYAREYVKTNGFKAIPFYLTVKWWENIGTRYSDKFITLNERDSALLKRIYNKKVTIEIPTSFDDKYEDAQAIRSLTQAQDAVDYLFVGVAFFANIQGVQWFIDNVMPRIKGNLYIVGKGMDKVSFNNLTNNIHIYGYVEDLADFYYRARMVVSPIFVGGGMKTKTAEALMFGKNIVGTEEAFEGYRIDDRCMYKCSTPDDFAQSIALLQGCTTFNQYSRDLFKNYYSTDVALNALKRIFNE